MARSAKLVAPVAPVAVDPAMVQAIYQQILAAQAAAGVAPVAAVEAAPTPAAVRPAKAPAVKPAALADTVTPVLAKSGASVIVKGRTTKKGKRYHVISLHPAWGGNAILTRAQWVALCNAIRGDRKFCLTVAELLAN